MSIEISLVPYGMLTQTIGGLGKHLVTAAKLTEGRCLVDDLVKFFYNGHYSLWLIFKRDVGMLGFYAVEVKQYPQCRMLCVQHCVTEPGTLEDGGSAILQDTLRRYAKDTGCSGVEFVGRPGWGKKFGKEEGYEATNIVFQLFLTEVAK